MLALLTNVIAFALVIYLWTSIISYKRDITRSRYILSIFLALNIGCTLAGVVDLCMPPLSSIAIVHVSIGRIGNYEDYLANSKAYETIVIVNALSLFILCIGMFVYGMILKLRLDLSLHDLLLRSHGSHMVAENTKKIRLLRRILIILGICFSCFFLRVICLAVLLYDVTTSHHLTDQIPLVVWYTFSQWIPNFGAGYTLLYIMRTRLEAKTRSSHQTPTARQYQQSVSGTSFRPSSHDQEIGGAGARAGSRGESKGSVSGLSPIFIASNDCDISHDGSGGSGVVRDSVGNPIQFRQDDWSGEWIEGMERCFPSDDS
jgi:hypothetical protein